MTANFQDMSVDDGGGASSSSGATWSPSQWRSRSNWSYAPVTSQSSRPASFSPWGRYHSTDRYADVPWERSPQRSAQRAGRRSGWVMMARNAPASRGYEVANRMGWLVREDAHTGTALIRFEQGVSQIEGWFAQRFIVEVGSAEVTVEIDTGDPAGRTTRSIFHDWGTGTTCWWDHYSS